MDVPLLELPAVYHLGRLDPASRGSQFSTSYEGSGLSVSLCPAAWEAIAKLGGSPLSVLRRPGALYLDILGLGRQEKAEIAAWAEAEGLAEATGMWRALSWDEETEEWGWCDFLTEDEAVSEALFRAGEIEPDPDADGSGLEEAVSYYADEFGASPPGPLVRQVPALVLTEAGSARARGFGRDQDASDIAAMFWAEDVLRPAIPSVVGVWWSERYEPLSLSAPRGAIFASEVGGMEARRVRRVPDDEELLAGMPEAATVSVFPRRGTADEEDLEAANAAETSRMSP